jgi:antiviral helicase SKI2
LLARHPHCLEVLIQINSVNELILTELILDNTLGDFEPEEIVALLSAFVFEEKTDTEPQISTRLEEVYPFIRIIAG